MNAATKTLVVVCMIVCLCRLTGCATVRHPAAYEGKRPQWTYDVSLVDEQALPEACDKENYQLFLGVESTSCATEEGARMGALLNAYEQAKIFLHSRGEVELNHLLTGGERIKSKRWRSDRDRFFALLDSYADAEVAHMEGIHWYLEEHRSLWRSIWPFSNDTRGSSWRAWCIAAIPRKVCDRIIEEAIRQYGEGIEPISMRNEGTIPMEKSSVAVDGTSNSYGHRVAKTAYRGVANLVCAPVEIVNQPFVYSCKYSDKSEVLQLAGFFEGVPMGVVMAGIRAVDGVASLVSAPLGGYEHALVNPDLFKPAPCFVW